MSHSNLVVRLVVIGIIAIQCAGAATFPMLFEDYSTGELLGQGAGTTKWVGSTASGLMVTAGAGIGNTGTNALVTYASPTNANLTTLFLTSSTDLPTFSGSSSIVNFAFQYRYGATPISGNFTTGGLTLYMGFDSSTWNRAAHLSIRPNGTFSYGSLGAKNFDGSAFTVTDASTIVTVYGQLDYAQQKFNLYISDGINGAVQQTDAGGNAWMAFGAASSKIGVGLLDIYQDTSTYGFVPVVFDNLNITIVPEPQVSLLLVVGVGGLIVRRKNAIYK